MFTEQLGAVFIGRQKTDNVDIKVSTVNTKARPRLHYKTHQTTCLVCHVVPQVECDTGFMQSTELIKFLSQYCSGFLPKCSISQKLPSFPCNLSCLPCLPVCSSCCTHLWPTALFSCHQTTFPLVVMTFPCLPLHWLVTPTTPFLATFCAWDALLNLCYFPQWPSLAPRTQSQPHTALCPHTPNGHFFYHGQTLPPPHLPFAPYAG